MTTPHAVYPIIAAVVLVCWVAAVVCYLPVVANRVRFPLGRVLIIIGWLILAGYIAWMWVALERPPMRTQGETRLWYTLLLAPTGVLIEWRILAMAKEWRGKSWIISIPTVLIASVFLVLNLFKPELFDKSLMPALQSPWFVPHVIVYIISYAIFGLVAGVALVVLVIEMVKKVPLSEEVAPLVQQIVNIGFPFMTAGLVFGALWAKVAWGHYWSWDPKETWAFISWSLYLIYMHLKSHVRLPARAHLAILAVGFLLVLGCWFGVNALPTSQDSMHSYMQ